MAKSETLVLKKDAEKKNVEPQDAEPGERPKNLRANSVPTDGFGLEVDGKMKSQHPSSDAAFKAGQELKRKFPLIQVKVFDAKAQTRTIVELPGA
jgi:hypothetical protein